MSGPTLAGVMGATAWIAEQADGPPVRPDE